MRFLLSLLLVLGLAVPASAQLGSVPFVFTSGTVISSSEVNQNFATAYSNALNRTGGTMTGTLNIRDLLPVTDNTYDLGSAGFSFQDGFFDGVMTAVSAVISSTGASALDVAGGINAGTGNVGIVGTDGRVPAISSTYFASLSGANLTSVPETAITDGSLLARVAANETISGTWFYSAGLIRNGFGLTSGALSLTPTNYNGFFVASNLSDLSSSSGTRGAQVQAALPSWGLDLGGTFGGDASVWGIDEFAIYRRAAAGSWTRLLTISNTGLLTHPNAVGFSNFANATLSGGENHNWAPTGFSTVYTMRVQGNAITPSKITGIAGGSAGRKFELCNVGSDIFSLVPSSASSTASNRIAGDGGDEFHFFPGTCAVLSYDPTSSLWRVNAGVQILAPL
jgi:hypothetical protein